MLPFGKPYYYYKTVLLNCHLKMWWPANRTHVLETFYWISHPLFCICLSSCVSVHVYKMIFCVSIRSPIMLCKGAALFISFGGISQLWRENKKFWEAKLTHLRDWWQRTEVVCMCVSVCVCVCKLFSPLYWLTTHSLPVPLSSDEICGSSALKFSADI